MTTVKAALLGDTRIESQLDSNTSGQAEAFPVKATASGSIASLAFYLDHSSTAQQVAVGLYADAGGIPGTLLAQASTATPQAGAWNSLATPAVSVVQGKPYWIAILSTGSGTIEFRDSDRGNCNSQTSAQTTLTALPATWQTGAKWATCKISAYGSGLAAAAPTSVTVAVSPIASTLAAGNSQQFTASVSGTSNTSVTWTASGGSISSSGMYTAPMSAGSFVVTATSMADTNKSASASVTVMTTATVAVSISPASASLTTGGTQQFAASVTGSSNTAVTWSATGGTISSSGLYTAPSTAGTYTVTATSAADTTKSASATVTVSAPAVVAVAISPTSASLSTGGTQQFTATVTGSSNTAVSWSATGGTISSAGLYTAPSTAGTYTVTATSAADTTKSASATVTVSTAVQHSATLSWSSESGVSGYNVYRGTVSGGPYTIINTALVAPADYTDLTVEAGQTYYYVVTAVNSSGVESVYSNQVTATIP